MSTPRPTEGISIRVLPLAVFALILIAPFLNFQFTLYRSTLKLFAYQTAATLLWSYLAWEWAAGRLGRSGWPAWWLFAPVAAWWLWGLATAVWSPQGWLAAGWLVQGLYGAAGALGLAILLQDAGQRRVFVAAASAVAFALAFLMVLYYGDPRSGFLGDIDRLDGREAGAAFLILPTLAAAALLYRRARKDGQEGYRGVLWLAALLTVLLGAGLRTGTPAWRYGLGAGLAALAWLALPRWRLAAGALAVTLVFAIARHELHQGLRVASYTDPAAGVRRAVLDRAEWGIVRRAPLARLLAGNGVGTLQLLLDRERPPWTYAVSYGDEAVGHARRQLTEELLERGIVGLGLALLMGLAWLAAGVLAFRRARDAADSALGAGLAAAGAALGVFACFSNGAIGFGSAMVWWLGLGLLGALSCESGRPAGLSWSPEEEQGRAEAGPRARLSRTIAASAAVLGLAIAWAALAARPFWAEYCLREGQAEDAAARRLHAQKKLAEQTLAGRKAAGERALEDLAAKVREAEAALRATETAPPAEGHKEAVARLESLRAAAPRAQAELEAAIRQLQDASRTATEDYDDAARRTARYLSRASTLSLGDRVWLDAQMLHARHDAACDRLREAAGRLELLDARCGPAFDLDVQRAECYAKLARTRGARERAPALRAEAHSLYRRYAAKNPLGAACALFTPRVPFYEDWSRLIAEQRAAKRPEALAWANDFIAATSAGLAWQPNHYGLMLLRGDMAWWLGDKAAARRDMIAAADIIEEALGHIAVPLVRARLYLELANANLRWDKDKALKAAKQVILERVDFHDPQTQHVLMMTHQIIRHLEPPKKAEPKP